MRPPKCWCCKALDHDLKFFAELEPETKKVLNGNFTLTATYKLLSYIEKPPLLCFHSENVVGLVKSNKSATTDRPRG